MYYLFLGIIRSISSIPIKYLVITHHHPDHSFGISSYQELGVEIIMSSSEILRYEKYGKRLLKFQINYLLICDFLELSQSMIGSHCSQSCQA